MDIEEPYRADWEKMGVFKLHAHNSEPTFKAYSMANHPAEGDIIMLNVRIATPPFDRAKNGFMNVPPGISSSYIFSRKPGDKVIISGPYGEFFIKTEKTGRKVNFFYGARSLKEAFYLEDFHEIERDFPNFKFHLALDRQDPEADAAGVAYKVGFVHNVLYETYLKAHEAPEDCLYLMCGPPMMTQSVLKMLDSLGVPPENILFDNFGS